MARRAPSRECGQEEERVPGGPPLLSRADQAPARLQPGRPARFSRRAGGFEDLGAGLAGHAPPVVAAALACRGPVPGLVRRLDGGGEELCQPPARSLARPRRESAGRGRWGPDPQPQRPGPAAPIVGSALLPSSAVGLPQSKGGSWLGTADSPAPWLNPAGPGGFRQAGSGREIGRSPGWSAVSASWGCEYRLRVLGCLPGPRK